jgi:hypothetical protein
VSSVYGATSEVEHAGCVRVVRVTITVMTLLGRGDAIFRTGVRFLHIFYYEVLE